MAFFPGPPRWAGARRELMDFMVQGKINRGRHTAPTIWLGTTPSGLTSAHLHHPPFLQAGCPSCHPANSVKALKAKVPKYKYKILGVKCTCKCKYIYLKFSELQKASVLWRCWLSGRKGIWAVESEWWGSISDELEAVWNVMFPVK